MIDGVRRKHQREKGTFARAPPSLASATSSPHDVPERADWKSPRMRAESKKGLPTRSSPLPRGLLCGHQRLTASLFAFKARAFPVLDLWRFPAIDVGNGGGGEATWPRASSLREPSSRVSETPSRWEGEKQPETDTNDDASYQRARKQCPATPCSNKRDKSAPEDPAPASEAGPPGPTWSRPGKGGLVGPPTRTPPFLNV